MSSCPFSSASAATTASASAAAGDGKQHPDILRFGLTPLYLGYADVWHAVRHLKEVMDTQEWQQARFSQKHAVT